MDNKLDALVSLSLKDPVYVGFRHTPPPPSTPTVGTSTTPPLHQICFVQQCTLY